MTKTLRCHDLVAGCRPRRGRREDEVARQAADHAQTVQGMKTTPALAEQVRGVIREE